MVATEVREWYDEAVGLVLGYGTAGEVVPVSFEVKRRQYPCEISRLKVRKKFLIRRQHSEVTFREVERRLKGIAMTLNNVEEQVGEVGVLSINVTWMIRGNALETEEGAFKVRDEDSSSVVVESRSGLRSSECGFTKK